MPAKRQYNIKGTNDFLVLAAIFFFLCLWAVKDAWYPSEKVLKKHPLTVSASFEIDGAVEKVLVSEGDSIGEDQVLARLRRDKAQVEFEAAKDAYTEAKKKHAMMKVAAVNAEQNGASDAGIAEIQAGAAEAGAKADEALAQVEMYKNMVDASDLKAPSKGQVKQILVGTHSLVEAGETIMIIDPKDHFYLFNKSLAVFSFLAFWVFLAIHVLAR